MAMPQILQVRLPALDTNLQAIGPGRALVGTAPNQSALGGARTRAGSLYDLFLPQGTYIFDTRTTNPTSPLDPNYDVGTTRGSKGVPDISSESEKWIVPGSYDPANSVPPSDELTIELLPGQLRAFAQLYKLARVERVDFNFKFTNLGVSAIVNSLDVPTTMTQSMASSSVSHLLTVLPKSQWSRMLNLNSLTDQWSPDSKHSNSNAA